MVAGALRDVGPAGAAPFRIHGDAFALLIGPGEETPAADTRALASNVERRFEERLRASPVTALHDAPVRLTTALLHLVVTRPSTPAILGPLVHAELERALLVSRVDVSDVNRMSDIQERRIDLQGHVPPR